MENGIFMSVALPITHDENGDYEEDDTRTEALSIIPNIITAKAGDEVTIVGSFSAESLEVGRYLLLCGSETGLLHTDLEFEVVEADPTGIDKPATADDQKAQWYDMQGRRMPQKPTTPGIYIRNGKKVIVK